MENAILDYEDDLRELTAEKILLVSGAGIPWAALGKATLQSGLGEVGYIAININISNNNGNTYYCR